MNLGYRSCGSVPSSDVLSPFVAPDTSVFPLGNGKHQYPFLPPCLACMYMSWGIGCLLLSACVSLHTLGQ